MWVINKYDFKLVSLKNKGKDNKKNRMPFHIPNGYKPQTVH